MLSNKDMNKDIHDMKMSEIEVYVESLKETIYHLTSTMQTLLTSVKEVQVDLNQFNSLKVKKNNNTRKRKPIIQESVEIEEADENEENYEEEITEEFSNDVNNCLEDYNNDSSNNNSPFVVSINFMVERTKAIHSMLMGNSINDFMIKDFEPDEYHEIIDQVGYDPRFYFNNLPTKKVINDFWLNFITNYANDTFPLETIKMIKVTAFDRFQKEMEISMK